MKESEIINLVKKRALEPLLRGSATLEIFFDDLIPETQSEVLRFYGMTSPDEGNFDDAPLFVLEYSGDEE